MTAVTAGAVTSTDTNGTRVRVPVQQLSRAYSAGE
jgi:hypothetical protein